MKNTKYCIAILLLILAQVNHIISSQHTKKDSQEITPIVYQPKSLMDCCLKTVAQWGSEPRQMPLHQWYKEEILKTMEQDTSEILNPFDYDPRLHPTYFHKYLETCLDKDACEHKNCKYGEDYSQGLIRQAIHKKNSLPYLQFLVDEVGLQPNPRDHNVTTPLELSLYTTVEQVKFFIDRIGIANAISYVHFTKNSIMLISSPEQIVSYLIDAGYDVNQHPESYGGVFDVTTNSINSTVDTILFNQDDNPDYEISTERIKFLQSKGLNINKRDRNGDTALHTAIYDYKKTKQLIDCGADLNIQNNSGETPLHLVIATQEDTSKTIEQLILAGANIHKRTLPKHGSHKAIDLVINLENSQAYYRALEAKKECAQMADEDINIQLHTRNKKMKFNE